MHWADIVDNAGRIISGINGDTSGTVIQGKKLVINSDTTIAKEAELAEEESGNDKEEVAK